MNHLVVSFVAAASVALLLHPSPSQAGEWPESCGNNKSHNFYFGKKNFYDSLYYSIRETKSRSLLSKLSYDFNIPPKGTYPKGLIDYIEVLDQYRDGNGACAYWKSGGPGSKNATLHIKSQRNQGVDFIINVYGR